MPKLQDKIHDLYVPSTGLGMASFVTHIALSIAIFVQVSLYYSMAMYSPSVIYFNYYPAAFCIGLYFLYCNYPEKSVGACMIIMALLSAVSMILYMVQLNMTEPAEELFNGQYQYPLWNVTHEITVNVTNRQTPPEIGFYTYAMVMSFIVFAVSILWFGFGFYMIKLDGVGEGPRYSKTRVDTEGMAEDKKKHYGIPWVPVMFMSYKGKDNCYVSNLRAGITTLCILLSILAVIMLMGTYFFLAVGLIHYSPFTNMLFILVVFVVMSIKPPPLDIPSKEDDNHKRELFEMVVYGNHVSTANKQKIDHRMHGGFQVHNENVLWGFGEMNWCHTIYLVFFVLAVGFSWVVWLQHILWRDYNQIGFMCTNVEVESGFANRLSPRNFLFYGNEDETPVMLPIQQVAYRSDQPGTVAQFSCAVDWLNLIFLFLTTLLLFMVIGLYSRKYLWNDMYERIAKLLENSGEAQEYTKLLNEHQIEGFPPHVEKSLSKWFTHKKKSKTSSGA